MRYAFLLLDTAGIISIKALYANMTVGSDAQNVFSKLELIKNWKIHSLNIPEY